ncbi:MAG: four helix bundle protein [Verrucomicrobia bacterium]|nr:four helix bundle protein [Verrucomicrobiota bacterium]
MKIERFEDIEAWPACQGAGRQLARELTRKVYRLTKKPSFEKDYGLKRQFATPPEKITVNREP